MQSTGFDGGYMNYFTADTHFFHKSLIHDRIFSNRDFLCVEEMNEQIMDAWNEVVCDQDTVYHLGDIALVDGKTKAYEKVDQLLKSLNGQIVFIKGNHDSRAMFKYLEKHNATLQNARKKYLFNDVGLILKFDKKQFFIDYQIAGANILPDITVIERGGNGHES
jgi:calcineurin-like phosphoesterase family protein